MQSERKGKVGLGGHQSIDLPWYYLMFLVIKNRIVSSDQQFKNVSYSLNWLVFLSNNGVSYTLHTICYIDTLYPHANVIVYYWKC